MKFPGIRIEGSIFSGDILDQIEQGEIAFQSPKDFGFDPKIRVKDEIARAWADAQDMWRIFKRQRERVGENATGTSETRKFWIIPLMGLLGYDLELSKAEIVNDRSYALSHRAVNADGFAVHVMGFNDSLDTKRTGGGPRMSPHALLQEYLNLTEHLYAIVTNGIRLRVLRDSSRLIKLSFIEFDLETMMEEEHYADFAVMFRLIHMSRMPQKADAGADSIIEKYHQDALDSGSRIREGLSRAVEKSILSLANGFLRMPENEKLRQAIDKETLVPSDYYQFLLRLIYRILFLMVIEERNLIFTRNVSPDKRKIYQEYYSINRLRKLCEKRYLADKRFNDHWIAMKNAFRLFETWDRGRHLDIKPLAGNLFGYNAIGMLNDCQLDNQTLLECLKNLSIFTHRATGQTIRVNYGALDVEEFGSVYEGLLEYAPRFVKENGGHRFVFVKGTDRSSSGSHYTPDELVKPLIKHSLDYVIEEKLKSGGEKGLLSIKVCDVACGSGHILLNAARRIGTELAKARAGEDQPSPSAFRQAVRDVIQNCIYGVDKNPLAVELCKVALWLEAHNPGEPLNFLDHHIKCGDAIVGLAHMEELERGIPDEAFKPMPDDDKKIRAELAKQNKAERGTAEQRDIYYEHSKYGSVKKNFDNVSVLFEKLNHLPEKTIEEIEEKQKAYQKLMSGHEWWRLKTLADMIVAQFFIPKNEKYTGRVATDADYRDYFSGRKSLQNIKAAEALAVSQVRQFFHWFLEFPEVFALGGFDCILGNPPFLGGKRISGNLGIPYLNYLKFTYKPAGGLADLVVYFFRRVFELIKTDHPLALISTNTISQGDSRIGGLQHIIKNGGELNFAIKSVRWPGVAALEVALVAIFKQKRIVDRIINGKKVDNINSFLSSESEQHDPYVLIQNHNKSFIGSLVNGTGFILTDEEANNLIKLNDRNSEIIFPYLNGADINSSISQEASRFIINFFDWPIEKAKEYEECYTHVLLKVKPHRDKVKRKIYQKLWWQYAEKCLTLYEHIKNFDKVLVVAETGKYGTITFVKNKYVFSHMVVVFGFDTYSKFAVLQSDFHYYWAAQFASTMGQTLRYTPIKCFQTFPFPQNLSPETELEHIGETYHEFRRQIMLNIQLGLTKTYNLFHTKDLTVEDVIKAGKQEKETCEKAYADILKLRQLHKQMDETVLKAYGWQDINLAHDFYEVDYLPENDRVRYTIAPDARKEILTRLLKLNHEIHEQELKPELTGKPQKKTKKEKPGDHPQQSLF